jgi:hypothetical protein
MREAFALTLVLLSTIATADEWVVLRRQPDPGESGPAGILVDSTSIEVLDTGIRRARHKSDFLGHRLELEKFAAGILAFAITVTSYDCKNQMTRDESVEFHNADGAFRSLDLSKNTKWYPAPENRTADPTIEFVCAWKLK